MLCREATFFIIVRQEKHFGYGGETYKTNTLSVNTCLIGSVSIHVNNISSLW